MDVSSHHKNVLRVLIFIFEKTTRIIIQCTRDTNFFRFFNFKTAINGNIKRS